MPRPALALAMIPFFTADLFDDEARRRLRLHCDVLDLEPLTTLEDERANALLPRTEILLTGWGCPPIDATVLARAPQLKAIVHAAGTIKMHVTDACWERGILVTAAAAANALPVAEFTLAAILFANKRAIQLQRRYAQERELRWWPLEFPGLGNYRKIVGIVGASFIGRRVIELLEPFDLEALLYDPYLDEAGTAALGARKVELDDLVKTADVVSLHAPALLETYQMMSRERLALMKTGATLINTARGWLVDGIALEEELKSGRIFAVLDTTEPEILPKESPLYDLPNVFLTPHIAGAMGGETRRLGDLAVDEIERYARGEPFRYGIGHEDLGRIA
jgi:phosphoglycerate dehydrogenase-like enzyme